MQTQSQTDAGMDGHIFALDIGTHNVIGVVGQRQGSTLHIDAVEQLSYPGRAMRDGQIEDIEQVAKTAQAVTEKLEQNLGLPLRAVHVAAAGRALRTHEASFEMSIDDSEPINGQQVAQLEMGAIEQAQQQLVAASQGDTLCYVGHSVVRYELDGYEIAPLIGHRGKSIRAYIIATFLPSGVVDSLYAAMKGAGLTVQSLTLEPIAAMNAIIPKELRLLNLALVDIGAGTSDIAVSENGSVTAYTMATIAGDEITEAIVQAFLVDFETAERMKCSLSDEPQEIQYEDILGFSYTVSPQALWEKIQPAVDCLCQEICTSIMTINGKSPAAVFLVGGASNLSNLCGLVANGLSIAENKVAVGGNNYMKKIIDSSVEIKGPQYATPVGIAVTAMLQSNEYKYTVTLNGRLIEMRTNAISNVMELLLDNGYERNDLLGRSGKSIAYELDGQLRMQRGGRPIASVIMVNGQPASITTTLRPGDNIQFTPAVPGEDATLTVRQVVGDTEAFSVIMNGNEARAGLLVYRDGREILPDMQILDRDSLTTRFIGTVAELYEAYGFEQIADFTVNGMPESPDYQLCEGDEVIGMTGIDDTTEQETVQAKELTTQPATDDTMITQKQSDDATVVGQTPSPAFDEEQVVIEKKPAEKPALLLLLNGEELTLPPKEDGSGYQFVDLLNFVDLDPQNPQGNIILRHNGANASYLQAVHDRDSIEIYWEDEKLQIH